jgi:histidinol-phosphate aminotransferase
VSYEYERVVTPSSGLRLHLNENTGGCSPRVLEALRRMSAADVAFYPDYDRAIGACAARLGTTPDRLLLTNGLDDGILAVSILALRRGAADGPCEVVITVPAFDMYAACADAVGGTVVQVPQGPDFTFPEDRVLAAIGSRTRLVWLTNPNNPTGQVIPREMLRRVARSAAHALVVVDEAYADFSGETLIGDPEAARLPNLIVGRTFAKAHGLAGLRAGALIGAPETLAPLRGIVAPYTINAATAIALPVALEDTEHYDSYCAQVRESKALLYAALDRLRVQYWPSGANFVLVRLGSDSARIIRELTAREIFVRDRSADPGCAGCIRVTTGLVEHTRAFIRALEEVLCDAA